MKLKLIGAFFIFYKSRGGYINWSLFISHAFTPTEDYSPKRQFKNSFH